MQPSPADLRGVLRDEGEYWPALLCSRCPKSLAVLRLSVEGLAVISVNRKGVALPATLDAMNAVAFGPDRRQLELVTIAGLEKPHDPNSTGRHPKSYAVDKCNPRCSRPPTRVSVARLSEATRQAAAERRDVFLGVHV